jgi:hypothetical protein
MVKVPFLKYDYSIGDDWRSREGQKVVVKFKRGKRYGLRQGILRIVDYPFGCSCCGCTTAVLTDRDGKVKWSSMANIISPGDDVGRLVAMQPQLRADDLG